MGVIDTLVYDRTASDVSEVVAIKRKILTEGLSSLTAEQKAAYLAGMKGAYNYTDLNRVGSAVTYVASRLVALPPILAAYRDSLGIAYDPVFDTPYDADDIVVSVKTDWVMGDTPTAAQMATYLANLTVLHDALPLPSDAPAVPSSMSQLTWETANDIEELLYVVDGAITDFETDTKSLMDRAVLSFVYCGDFYSGE